MKTALIAKYSPSPTHPLEREVRRWRPLTAFLIIATISLSTTALGQEKLNLGDARKEVLDYLETLLVPGKPYGCYRLNPGGEADIYATCDVVMIRTLMGEDLTKTLTTDQRQQWIDYINSFAQENGEYKGGRHSKEHRNGMVVAALGPLGGKQKYPVKFYEEYNTPAEITQWLEKFDWKNQWTESHLFWGGMMAYSMSKQATKKWRKEVFKWLNTNLDPNTGQWRKGVKSSNKYQWIGGGAHIWPIYQLLNKPFPYPKQAIDGILEIQQKDGSWISRWPNYLDLDALYGLTFMTSYASDYRRPDIAKAVTLQGNHAIKTWKGFVKAVPVDTHRLLAAVSILGLLQQLDPERFPDTVKWTDIFSDARFYKTRQVEIIQKK